MKHAPTLNADHAVAPDFIDFKEHQVTILLTGTAPAGSEIALKRKAAGSDIFLPVTIDDVPVVFTPDALTNDTVTITMQVDEIQFVPNATYIGEATAMFGYKIISRRG